MIDHLLGRPSSRLKRLQVILVIAFWSWIIRAGPRDGPSKIPWVQTLNRHAKRYAPWRLFVFALTSVYAVRHLDALAGFGAPEPLAHMYSRPYYRVTWINTALEAGFASAMSVRPQWLRDIMSMLFSVYYVIYANEADEKLRRFRAFCTIDFLRATWEKTTNPYLRAVTWFHRPSLPLAQQVLLPRPTIGPHAMRPIRTWLFYAKAPRLLREEDELVIDFVGGGFVCMDPRHHEERLRQTAKELKRPVLAVDYCKAPEYPYPFALEECFDLYRSLHESKGLILGMSGRSTFRTILTGDSAGGNLAAGVMLKILEYPQPHIKSAYAAKAAGGPGSAPPALPRPIAIVLNYPAMNMAFTSWMKPDHVNVLRSQSEVNLQNITPMPKRRLTSRKRDSIDVEAQVRRSSQSRKPARTALTSRKSYMSLASQAEMSLDERAALVEADQASPPPSDSASRDSWIGRIESDDMEDAQANKALNSEDEDERRRREQQKALQAATEKMDSELNEKQARSSTVHTRLTMTSMAAYFQDRILSQSMMRAMAILYIGPRRQPDFDNDYFLSPIVAPAKYLADFPPVLFTCGEKDPICDDTVVMAGRIRQAKLARQVAMKRRGAPFGEKLRMSGAATVEEDEDAEDWVQMRIIEGWSHGYLQMSSLLPEAKRVISFLAHWMEAAFDDYNERVLLVAKEQGKSQEVCPADVGMANERLSPPSGMSIDGGAAIATTSKGSGQSPSSSPRPVKVRPVLGAYQPPQSSSDEDDEEPLTFTPKSRRSPSLQSNPPVRGSPVLSASPRTSPQVTGTTINAAAAVPAVKPNVAKLQMQNNANVRRPSSFSHPTEAMRTANSHRAPQSSPIAEASSMLLPPPAMPARRRLSMDHATQTNGADTGFVKESSLLERRRMDAVSYIGGTPGQQLQVPDGGGDGGALGGVNGTSSRPRSDSAVESSDESDHD